jgi:hypothetical protein
MHLLSNINHPAMAGNREIHRLWNLLPAKARRDRPRESRNEVPWGQHSPFTTRNREKNEGAAYALFQEELRGGASHTNFQNYAEL